MTTPENPPLPTPPFHLIPNLNNLRDAALHPLTTSSGHPLRANILFRSAEVSHLSLPEWRALHALGIAHVFDLRSKPEVDKGWAGIVGAGEKGDNDVRPGWIEAMEQAGVKRTWSPVFAESDYSPERLAERYSKYMGEGGEGEEGFVAAYKDIAENAGEAFGRIFRYLADLPEKGPRGALIHCTAGKDRTGMFFGILFEFLHVPRELIADEYNRTETGLAHVREEVVKRLMASPLSQRMMSEMAGEDGEVTPEIRERGRQAALRMIGARKESMLRSLDMLDRVFGGAEKYMREKCGLGDEELERLRRNLVVQE